MCLSSEFERCDFEKNEFKVLILLSAFSEELQKKRNVQLLETFF